MAGINQFVYWAIDKAKRTRNADRKAMLVSAIKLVDEYKSTLPKRKAPRPSNSPPLTPELAKEIKAMWKQGYNTTEISVSLGVNQSAISKVLLGKTYTVPDTSELTKPAEI